LNAEYELDWSGQNRLRVNQLGEIAEATVKEQPAKLCAYEEERDISEYAQQQGPTMVYASPAILMSTAIKIRHHTGLPVPMVESGKLVGVISGDEIFHGLLRLGAPDIAA
jgi:glycine betaine/proline transport system ATP-binding protein